MKGVWIRNKALFKRLFSIFMGIFILFSFRVVLDITINGLNKAEKLVSYKEVVAHEDYKPSTLSNNPEESFFGLRMRSKGITINDLFNKYQWHKKTFYSFFGVYGRMDVYPKNRSVYTWFLIIFIIFILSNAAFAICQKNCNVGKYLLLFLIGTILIILISIYHSWTGDFQAQGRYLFPFLPLLFLYLYKANSQAFLLKINVVLFNLFFLLSMYSFIFTALKDIPKFA